jgi:hypothetical protein
MARQPGAIIKNMKKKTLLLAAIIFSLIGFGALSVHHASASTIPQPERLPEPQPETADYPVSCSITELDYYLTSTTSECSCTSNGAGEYVCEGNFIGYNSALVNHFTVTFTAEVPTGESFYYATLEEDLDGFSRDYFNYKINDPVALDGTVGETGEVIALNGTETFTRGYSTTVNNHAVSAHWKVKFSSVPIEIVEPNGCGGDTFTYDVAEDWFASVLVPANHPYTLVLDAPDPVDIYGSPDYGTVFYVETGFQSLVSSFGLSDWLSRLYTIAEDHPPAQRHEFAPGTWYAVDVFGGSWLDDGSGTPLYGLEYAWADKNYDPLDSEWHNITEDPDGALQCVVRNGDYYTVFMKARDTDLQFRPADEAESWESNTGYLTIDIYNAEKDRAPCEDNFTYDETEDFITSFTVLAEEAENDVTTSIEPIEIVEFEPGEVYVIDIVDGEWFNGSEPDPLYELEFAFTAMGTSPVPGAWSALDESSDPRVLCVRYGDPYMRVYLMADAPMLALRVKDEEQIFTDNTGYLDVNIYNALWFGELGVCDSEFTISKMIGSDTVSALADNGKYFAQTKSDTDMLTATWELEPLGWYMLETQEGPWAYDANGELSWDMQIKTNNTENYWEPLESWSEAYCIEEADIFGRLRVYFQAPDTETSEYYIRVADTEFDSASQSNLNEGEMKYTLWGVVKTSDCNFIIGDEFATGVIAGDNVYGEILPEMTSDDTNVVTDYYAITILDTSAWQESAGGADQYGAQYTNDALAGVPVWQPLPEADDVICTIENGNQLTAFMMYQSVLNDRALRVDSDSFGDNEGQLDYRIDHATLVDPFKDCFGYYDLTFLAATWIPVKEQMGVNIFADAPMQPGYTYALETTEGPWLGDEDDDGSQSYVAEISPDGGLNWYPLQNETVLENTCISEDSAGRYAQFVFTVTDTGPQWLIRVADENGEFLNNGGNLKFKLYQAEASNDAIVPPGMFTIDPACYGSCLMPIIADYAVEPSGWEMLDALRETFLLIRDIDLPGWWNYGTCYIKEFFAWCPRHTLAITNLGTGLSQYEPFATLSEFNSVVRSIQIEMETIVWEDSQAQTILSSENASSEFDDNFLAVEANSPWMLNGDLIEFSGNNTAYLDNCTTALDDVLAGPFLQGICFVSYQTHNTGFSFWLQIIVDVLAVGIFLAVGRKFDSSVNQTVK